MMWGRRRARVVEINVPMLHAMCVRIALMVWEERRPGSCPRTWRRVGAIECGESEN